MFTLATPTLESHVQSVVEQVQGMMEFVEESLGCETAAHEVERGLWARVLELGHALLGAFFVASGNGDEGERLALEDGREVNRLTARTRPYRSIFGDFRLERAVYGRREGQVIEAIPLDARLKLPADCTLYLLQEWNEHLMVEMPYAQAGAFLERLLGLRQSVQTLERQQERLSTSVGPFWAQHPAPPSEEEGAIMVDTVDGKGVAMRASETAGERGKKKMALLGSVSSIDPYRRTPEEVLEELFADPQTHREKSELARPKPLHKRVRACLARDACDTTAPHTAAVFEWIARENAQRNPDRLKPTVVLIDGQGSLWRAAWEFVPGEEVTEILDIVHVAGYVWEAANLVCGSDPDRARAWAKTQLGAILDGRIGEVIGRLHLHERYLRGKALERLERVRT